MLVNNSNVKEEMEWKLNEYLEYIIIKTLPQISRYNENVSPGKIYRFACIFMK